MPDENNLSKDSAVLPASAVSVMFGSRFAMAMPIWALAACRFASACSTSGRCATSCDGRLTGNFHRQLQTRQLKFFRRRLVRKPPGQNRQQVAQLGGLLEQRRQRGDDLRELRFLRDHVQPARITFGVLVAQDFHHVGIEVHELAGRVNLRLHRRRPESP